MRIFAKSLLILSVLVGLTLSNAMGWAHEMSCDSSDHCGTPGEADCQDALPCDAPPAPSDCPCEHDDHGGTEPAQPISDGDGGDCPLQGQDHHHHHHHQCVCVVANTWLISDSETFSLHPPLPGNAVPARQALFAPDSPVFLLDRPPKI